jgi:hypothetical protein
MICLRHFFAIAVIVALTAAMGIAMAARSLAAQAQPITIPFTLTADNVIKVRAVINGADTLDLMLHTAATGLMLTTQGVEKSPSVKFTGSDKVQSWGGESDSRASSGNRVEIGALAKAGITIFEDVNSGAGTDGKFGLDFFSGKIVEINFDRQLIVLYDRLPRKAKNYERLQMHGENGNLTVAANCLIDGQTYTNQFLIHSGYAGGILLDDAFAARSHIDGKIKINEESTLLDSFGHTIKVKKGLLPALSLGKLKLSGVPVGFFAGAIGQQHISIIGSGVLTRFNLIFDVVNNDLYLVPRSS